MPKASQDERANSPQKPLLIPNGIAPLSSMTGIKAIKKVASRVLLPKISIKSFDIASVI